MIYFIQAESGPIKIGYTQASGDQMERVRALQTAHFDLLTCLGVCVGGYTEEKELHDLFSAWHIRGEWFRPVPQLLQYILENARPYDPEIHGARVARVPDAEKIRLKPPGYESENTKLRKQVAALRKAVRLEKEKRARQGRERKTHKATQATRRRALEYW